jgi:alkylation response protein AidB-like acyl-CoA dehydrogenase
MDFSWSDEQWALRNSIVEFAQRELNDDLEARDAASSFSRELWDRCAAFGIQGMPFPVEHGGQGADTLTTVLALEALGYGCRDNGLLFSINAHMWSAAMPVWRFGTDDQKQRYLEGLCNGTLIGVQGMTEPDSGSDAFSMGTMARLDGNRYLLNGSKTFITNAPVADVFVVFASVDRTKGWAGLAAFLVDRGSPGLEVGEPFHKMGLRTSPMSSLFFADCEVPVENVLGTPGSGMMIFQHSIEWERSFILASAIGSLHWQLDTSVDYARQREQFDQPISKFQAVSHRLVDMKVRLEAGRQLLYRLAWLRDNDLATPLDAAMVKLFLSENLLASSLDALQTYGGYGYLTESGFEREVRDAVASRIYSGTSDIQRNVIARHMGL